MPFEVKNFAIRTWNVVLVFECRFILENVVFLRIMRFACGRAFGFGNFQFHFRNAGKFLFRKAVSIPESGLYFETQVAM